jgi:hypothetical protein
MYCAELFGHKVGCMKIMRHPLQQENLVDWTWRQMAVTSKSSFLVVGFLEILKVI